MPNALQTFTSALPKTSSRGLATVFVRSQITPEVQIDPTASPEQQQARSGGGFGNWIMSLVKPAVYVETPAGTIKAAPWGEPTNNYLPALLIASGVLVFSVLGVAYVLGKKSSR